MLIGTLYAPNGNPQPCPKLGSQTPVDGTSDGKAYAAELYALDAPVVLAGDYNVVPTDADITQQNAFKDNALVQPEPSALFARLLDQGWIDAIRTRYPRRRGATFWWLRKRWQRDAGLQLDHLLLKWMRR